MQYHWIRFPIFLITLLLFSSSLWAQGKEIPKVFHFIWLGKEIPSEYVDDIRSFKARNHDYEVNIWTDQAKHILKGLTQNEGASFPFNIRLIDEVKPALDPKLSRYLEREIQGRDANYAAASDILRYIILYLEGGVYLDTDLRALDVRQNMPTLSKQGEEYIAAHELALHLADTIEENRLYKHGLSIRETADILSSPEVIEIFSNHEDLTLLDVRRRPNKYGVSRPLRKRLERVNAEVFEKASETVDKLKKQKIEGDELRKQVRIAVAKYYKKLLQELKPAQLGMLKPKFELILGHMKGESISPFLTMGSYNNDLIAAPKGSQFIQTLLIRVLKRYQLVEKLDPDFLWSSKRQVVYNFHEEEPKDTEEFFEENPWARDWLNQEGGIESLPPWAGTKDRKLMKDPHPDENNPQDYSRILLEYPGKRSMTMFISGPTVLSAQVRDHFESQVFEVNGQKVIPRFEDFQLPSEVTSGILNRASGTWCKENFEKKKPNMEAPF